MKYFFAAAIPLTGFLALGTITSAQAKPKLDSGASVLPAAGLPKAGLPKVVLPEAVKPESVQTVANLLAGVMDTSAQAAANPKAANVQMTTCQIRVMAENNDLDRDSIFLYQEQAIAGKLDQPYRQRFLQIKPSTDGQVESQSFKPKNPQELIGFCDRPPSLGRAISSADLGTPVCSVFLKPTGDQFIGETPPQGCPTTARGAVRITNTVELFANGMDTWDRGFDVNGQQLWGAKTESYQYRRNRRNQ
jgi:CpeT/CpcT family (DUF1001)